MILSQIKNNYKNKRPLFYETKNVNFQEPLRLHFLEQRTILSDIIENSSELSTTSIAFIKAEQRKDLFSLLKIIPNNSHIAIVTPDFELLAEADESWIKNPENQDNACCPVNAVGLSWFLSKQRDQILHWEQAVWEIVTEQQNWNNWNVWITITAIRDAIFNWHNYELLFLCECNNDNKQEKSSLKQENLGDNWLHLLRVAKIWRTLAEWIIKSWNFNHEVIQYFESVIKRYERFFELWDPEQHEEYQRLKMLIKWNIQDNINKYFIDMVELSMPLHDIWKTKIPLEILRKPWKLTAEEFEIMKWHPALWYEIWRKAWFWLMTLDLILFHHKKFDWDGYPSQNIWNEIPLIARIWKIADVYDALISKRNYKPWFKQEVTLEIMQKWVWTEFDPSIMDIFLQLANNDKFQTKYQNN